MGWSSGTELMGSIIDLARKHIKSDKDRKAFFVGCIDAFEDADWDCQDECIGDDAMFDEALKQLHPDWEL